MPTHLILDEGSGRLHQVFLVADFGKIHNTEEINKRALDLCHAFLRGGWDFDKARNLPQFRPQMCYMPCRNMLAACACESQAATHTQRSYWDPSAILFKQPSPASSLKEEMRNSCKHERRKDEIPPHVHWHGIATMDVLPGPKSTPVSKTEAKNETTKETC